MTETMKQRYHRLKADGRCVQYGKHIKGGSYCDVCEKKQTESQARWYKRRKEEHRCVTCGKALGEADKGVRCKICAMKNSARCKAYYKSEKVEVLGDIKNALSKRS